MREGQSVAIYDPIVETLKGKRGTLVIRSRIEYVDAGTGYHVGTGTWKVVRGTGRYARITGGGRRGDVYLDRWALEPAQRGLLHPAVARCRTGAPPWGVRPPPAVHFSLPRGYQASMQALRETGATGLEPATSGVTGRSWRLRPERGWAGISGHEQDFSRVGLRGLPGACGRFRRRPAGYVRDGVLSYVKTSGAVR
jgi:hypothetical protein